MNHAAAIEFLYDLQMFGSTFGLENTRRLAELAAHPQDKLKFIHVAGTNGKGSVCAILESIYRAAGFRTGLYSSPHLIHFGERIRINNCLLSEAELIALTARMKRLLAEGTECGWWSGTGDSSSSDRGHPTFFEVVTVMALIHFAEQQCEIVLWETGLGGRLDATNIVTPEVSVITNIALEHTEYLGDTIEKIATEKCGIIKPGIPVLTGAENKEVLKVIREIAASRNAPLTFVTEGNSSELTIDGFENSYQQSNVRLAAAVVNKLKKPFDVSAEAMTSGLRNFVFPGRLQKIQRDTQTLLIDGAHNPASLRALRDSLDDTPRPTIFGCFKDKDLTPALKELLPMISRLLLVPVDSPRSATPDELSRLVRRLNTDVSVETYDSIATAFQAVANEPRVLITGSLYLAGQALNYLSDGVSASGSEQPLNDWTVSKK